MAVGQDRDCTEVWNDLWDNSGDAMPLARAEKLKRFGEHFGAMELRRLQVTVDDVVAAGMVAVPQRCCGVFSYCAAPNNPWAQCGGLLTKKIGGRQMLPVKSRDK
ncbi:MAG: hypothetical protein P8J91_03845 [Pirellulaceae bacterium]|nr:hypothetical protein [Pirellulaceae bacterium]